MQPNPTKPYPSGKSNVGVSVCYLHQAHLVAVNTAYTALANAQLLSSFSQLYYKQHLTHSIRFSSSIRSVKASFSTLPSSVYVYVYVYVVREFVWHFTERSSPPPTAKRSSSFPPIPSRRPNVSLFQLLKIIITQSLQQWAELSRLVPISPNSLQGSRTTPEDFSEGVRGIVKSLRGAKFWLGGAGGVRGHGSFG